MYIYVQSISLFFGNLFFLLTIFFFSPAVEAEKDAKYHIKRQDIGIFDLEFPNLQGLGAIIDGNCLVYINIFEFIEYIYIILEDNFIIGESKQQIINFFFILFAGSIVI